MKPEVKQFPVAALKAGADAGLEPGQFEAIVAVFNNVDSYGDRILPGAFADSLETRGFPPVVWSHRWEEPPIGASLEAEEVEGYKLPSGKTIDGLRILGGLYIEENARAREVSAAMAKPGGDGRAPLREFSFAYFTKEATIRDEPDEDGAWADLIQLDLIEVGPTLMGANPATELIGAASLLERCAKSLKGRKGATGLSLAEALTEAAHALVQLKEGRVLSSGNRAKLVGAIDAIQEVLDADADKDDDGKTRSGPLARDVAELLTILPAHAAAA